MLIDPILLGPNNENFSFSYERKNTHDGKLLFDNFNTSFFWRDTEKHNKELWGDDVVTLFVRLASDKTQYTRTDSQSGWPFYLQCLNFSTEILGTEEGILLCGFCPILQQSDSTLMKFLADIGIEGKGKKEDGIKMTRKWMEQNYVNRVVEVVRDIQSSGPIPLMIGDKVHRCMITIRGYGCKKH